MKQSAQDVICCPSCRGELALLEQGVGEEVLTGTLFCSHCQREFPIEQSIPHFIRAEELDGLNRRFSRLYDCFSYVYAPVVKLALALLMGSERKARMEILERLELTGGRFLEVSIGPGVNLPYLYEAPRLGEAYGLDISLGQLQRCRHFARKGNYPVDLFLASAEALPFRADSFDSILHIGGINFFSDKKRALEEMVRVAKPGTRIVVADETEQVARLYDRMPGFSRTEGARKAETAAPVSLLPQGVHDVDVRGIWKAHGQYHGWCLDFRKQL